MIQMTLHKIHFYLLKVVVTDGNNENKNWNFYASDL